MTYQTIKKFARELRKNQTPAESFFWDRVRNRRFLGKKINRQFVIQHENIMGKKRFFIADFYCHEKNLIIEIDGDIHQLPEQIEYDQIREDILREMGFVVVRFSNEMVLERWEDVEQALAASLGGRTHPASSATLLPLSCQRWAYKGALRLPISKNHIFVHEIPPLFLREGAGGEFKNPKILFL